MEYQIRFPTLSLLTLLSHFKHPFSFLSNTIDVKGALTQWRRERPTWRSSWRPRFSANRGDNPIFYEQLQNRRRRSKTPVFLFLIPSSHLWAAGNCMRIIPSVRFTIPITDTRHSNLLESEVVTVSLASHGRSGTCTS